MQLAFAPELKAFREEVTFRAELEGGAVSTSGGDTRIVDRFTGNGKIRGFGFSGKTVEGGVKALEQGDCAMVTYNLNEQAEKAVIDYAAAHGKGILVKKALASGHVCLEPGMDPIWASFMLLFAQTGVASAIVGTINPLHLAHNVATAAQVIRQL